MRISQAHVKPARWMLVLGVMVATGLLTAGSARAATYSGTLTGVPGSEISLTFQQEEGRLYLGGYAWGNPPWECEGGTESIGLSSAFNPPDGLVSQRRFRIRKFFPENDFIGLMSGEFNQMRTKLSGELRYRGRSSDPSLGVCDTGRIKWKASRDV